MKKIFKIFGVILIVFIVLIVFIGCINVKDSNEQEAKEKKIEKEKVEKKTFNEKSDLYDDVTKILREDRMNAIEVYRGEGDIKPKDRQTISKRIFDQYDKDEQELKNSKELKNLIKKDEKGEMTENERTEFVRSYSENYYRIAVEGKNEFKTE